MNEWECSVREHKLGEGGEWGLTTALSSLFSHAESCVSSVMASISTAQTVTLPLLKEHHCPTQHPLRGFWSSFETIEPLTNIKETSVQPAVMSLETHHRWLDQVIEFWRPVIHIDRAIENSYSKDGCSNGWRGAGEVCSLDSGSPCKPLTTSDRLAVGFRVCPGRYHFNHVMTHWNCWLILFLDITESVFHIENLPTVIERCECLVLPPSLWLIQTGFTSFWYISVSGGNSIYIQISVTAGTLWKEQGV